MTDTPAPADTAASPSAASAGRVRPPMPAATRALLDATLPYIESWIDYRTWRSQVPGAQVAIHYDGGLRFSRAFGVADLTSGASLTTNHLFRVASHSKTFTATAVLQLAERRMLRLDDTAGAHVPALAAGGSPLADVTVGELLGHGAGVIRDGLDADHWSSASPFPDEERLMVMLVGEGAIVQPLETFKYSNIGYSLLGLIIASVTGTTYAEALGRLVIDPLGLTDTGAEWEPRRADEFAAGHSGLHASRTRRVLDHVDTRAMASATGFFSTAEDMTSFASAHFDGDERLLTDRSKRMMRRTQWIADPDTGTDSQYGYGLTIEHYDGHRMIGHFGGYPGHITRTMWDPVDGLAISVLTNAIDGPAEELAAGILRMLDRARATPGAAPMLEHSEPEVCDLVSFTGRFASLWGVSDIAVIGDRLVLAHPSTPNPVVGLGRLEVVDADTLRIASGSGYGSVGESIRYHRHPDGSVDQVVIAGMTAWPIADYRERAGEGDDRLTGGSSLPA